jgi:oligopeptide/dipeptide ABC transporter, ATP-binding protein, C-terminal domain
MKVQKMMLSVKNLSVAYEPKHLSIKNNYASNKAVRDVSFEIDNGEAFGLIGESGCGKTTTAKAVCGLLNYSGSIKLNGNELSTLNRKQNSAEIQMIFQNPYSSLNPMMSIKRILEEPLIIQGNCSPKERLEKVKAMLDTIGLDESYLPRFVRELSGGQRQRIAIGCALMLNPRLIVADEILSALDVSVQSTILNMLSTLHKEMKVAFLFISHDINVVSYFCDRIAVMYNGEIVEIGNSVDLYNHPMHPYTAALIQAIPKIDKMIGKAGSIVSVEKAHSQGCKYAKYCSKWKDVCLSGEIPLIEVGNRKVRCHQIEERGATKHGDEKLPNRY